jgi:hypothetical protein
MNRLQLPEQILSAMAIPLLFLIRVRRNLNSQPFGVRHFESHYNQALKVRYLKGNINHIDFAKIEL